MSMQCPECPDENALMQWVSGTLPPQDRARISSHLDRCPRCYDTLALFADLTDPTNKMLGDGRFEIGKVLGRGAMGTVFAGHDRTLQRAVAIKILQFTDDVTEQQDWLLREARAMARLNHPHAVSVFDVLVDGTDLALIMELIPGGTSLRAWLVREPRTVAQIVHLYGQAGEALFAAHRVGLTHRDFKPENVLVNPLGVAKVTDFGLVRIQSAPESYRTRSETATSLVGTPAYMAPEVLLGGVADARSDQYSFCVSLYEALAGRRPFGPTPGRKGSMAAMLRTPTVDLPGVPAHIAMALLRGLSANPEQRFATMGALVLALKGKPATGEKHILAHILLQAVAFAFHACMTGIGLWALVNGDSTSEVESSATSSDLTSGPLETVIIAGIVMVALSTMLGWSPLSLAWTPINIYGLAQKRPWARISTLVYGLLGVVSCVGIPYAVYCLWSLRRVDVKLLFEGSADGGTKS